MKGKYYPSIKSTLSTLLLTLAKTVGSFPNAEHKN